MGVLERPIYSLLQTEPFFANFLLGSEIILDDPEITRAAVSFNNNNIQFYFNISYLQSITLKNQVAVMKHEVLHVLLDHCGKRYGDKINHEAVNYFKDGAINQMIPDLPEDCVTLESMEKICKKKLKPLENYEYYYAQAEQALPKTPYKGHSTDHDKMSGDGSGTDGSPISEAADSLRKAIIKDKVNKAISAAKGNIPQGLESVIANLNKAAQVNWRQQLRNLVASARSVTTKSNRMKVHRRFELDQPGKKKDRKLVLGVCTDSSGSVSDAAYSAFLNEIYSIAKSTTITYLVHADCEVQKVDIIKGGKAKGDVLKKRHGSGGTMYGPAIEHCTKLGCDAIIYFGDFDCADTPKNPNVPFIWVGVGSQPAPANFGKVLRINESN